MPRFVILEHNHPELHWDFMLESGEVLRTWRLATPPRAGEAMTALQLADHRRMYLDYEGPISGGRGRVIRWDRGTFVWQVRTEDQIVVRLEGEKLRGVLRLARVEHDVWRGEFLAEFTPPTA